MALTYAAIMPEISSLHSQFVQLETIGRSIIVKNRIEGAEKILQVLSALAATPNEEVGDSDWVHSLCGVVRNIEQFILFYKASEIRPSTSGFTGFAASPNIRQLESLRNGISAIIGSLLGHLRQLNAPLKSEFVIWVAISPAPELVKTQTELQGQLLLLDEQLRSHQKLIQAIPDDIALVLSNASIAIEAPFTDYKDRLSELLTAFDKDKKTAESNVARGEREITLLFSKLTGKALAGNYGENALDEKAQADSFRMYATALMTLILLLGAWMYYETFGAAYHWQSSVTRLVIILLLSVPAAYFARESIRHRQQYHQQLRMSLDLHAIDPFLASLPIAEQNKLKGEIALRLFGSRDSAGKLAEDSSSSITESLAVFIKKILEAK